MYWKVSYLKKKVISFSSSNVGYGLPSFILILFKIDYLQDYLQDHQVIILIKILILLFTGGWE